MKEFYSNEYYYRRNHTLYIAQTGTEVSGDEIPYNIETVAENLNIPWAMDINDDGKIYVTERGGTIRIIENGQLLPQPLITMGAPFISSGEGGLLGIALDPDFSNNHYLYVYHTYVLGNQIYNRVVRLLEKDNTAVVDKVIIDRIPGSQAHNGGRIKIGPDNKLYIATGDAGNTSLPQNLSSTAGKILRLELDGSIPQDNPFPNSPVYGYGLRNPQGLTWNTNGIMYASDHGATALDEINIIDPGGNYGWPLVQGDRTSPQISSQVPLIHSQENTWAPSGIAFSDRGPWVNQLLVACLRGMQLIAFTLNPEGTGVENTQTHLWNQFGRLREVIQAKDGSIYLSTNNKDGRGTPSGNDDRIIQLVPKQ